MELLLWAVGAIVGVLVLAGLGVLVREMTFPRSADRDVVLDIIHMYQTSAGLNEQTIGQLVGQGRREIVERNGTKYSVDLIATQKGERTYDLIVSVGKLRLFTFGHSEKLEIKFD